MREKMSEAFQVEGTVRARAQRCWVYAESRDKQAIWYGWNSEYQECREKWLNRTAEVGRQRT